MRSWTNASVRAKVLSCVILPVAALTALAALRVADHVHDVRATGQLRTLTGLSVHLGDLLHETQRERGRSTQFLGAKGARFQDELTAQRAATDSRLSALATFRSEHTGELPAATAAALSALDAPLADLSATRSATDALQPTPPIIEAYTTVNNLVLAAVQSAAMHSDDPGTARALVAYLSFMRAKELVGLERAQLTRAFSIDAFEPGQLVTVSGLIGAQRAFLTTFEGSASAQTLQRWRTMSASAEFTVVADLE